MTRKDYDLIASNLRRLYESCTPVRTAFDEGHTAAVVSLVDEFCASAITDNPRFDPDRFRRAVYGD